MTEDEAHQIARDFMDTRPDLRPMSLDEWMIEHQKKLTPEQRRAGQTILDLFDRIQNPPTIPPEHFDGKMHTVRVERGADFWLLSDAYKEAGFSMRVRAGVLDVQIPGVSPDHCDCEGWTE